MKELALGTKGEAETQVDESRLACNVGSGSLPVYATPMMVALMEQAACAAVRDALEEGETSSTRRQRPRAWRRTLWQR